VDPLKGGGIGKVYIKTVMAKAAASHKEMHRSMFLYGALGGVALGVPLVVVGIIEDIEEPIYMGAVMLLFVFMGLITYLTKKGEVAEEVPSLLVTSMALIKRNAPEDISAIKWEDVERVTLKRKPGAAIYTSCIVEGHGLEMTVDRKYRRFREVVETILGICEEKGIEQIIK